MSYAQDIHGAVNGLYTGFKAVMHKSMPHTNFLTTAAGNVKLWRQAPAAARGQAGRGAKRFLPASRKAAL